MKKEKHYYVKLKLEELRNGSTESQRISLPYKTVAKNILWFLSQTEDETTHTDIVQILEFKYNTVKNIMIKMRKSPVFNNIVVLKQNGNNKYFSKIPSDCDIEQLEKEIKLSIDFKKQFKKKSSWEHLTECGINFQYEFMWQNILHYVKEAGNRGLTIDEIYDTIPASNQPIDFIKKVKESISMELKRWPLTGLKHFYCVKEYNGKQFHILNHLIEMPMNIIINIIRNEGYKPTKLLQHMSDRNTTKEVHTGTTNNLIKFAQKSFEQRKVS